MLRLVVIASLLVSCRISLEEEDDGQPLGRRCTENTTSASCTSAVGHADLAWIQANIFTPQCAAFGACHNGTATELDLRDGMSYAELVDVSSVIEPTRKLVVANDTLSSYLMLMVGDFPANMATPAGVLPPAGFMPQGSPPLCCQKLDVLEQWITAGAPIN